MLTAGRGCQVAGGLVEKDQNGPGVASFPRHELMNFAQENRSTVVVCMMNFLAESTTTVINKALVAALWAPDLGCILIPLFQLHLGQGFRWGDHPFGLNH